MGLGEAKRQLPREFRGMLPSGVERAEVFCGGCLVVEGPSYPDEKNLGERLAKSGAFDDWQVVVIHDDADFAKTADKFLWATWTRFNPATDIYARNIALKHNQVSYESPIVIDARMKPWYPDEVEAHPDVVRLVDSRWNEYFG
jgi:3-polyprenyl-4-hydroxybenzoate decarboxylase